MGDAATIEGLEATGRLLGVDAGGSSTKVALVEAGQIAERWEIEPLNVLLQPALRGRLAALIGQVQPDAAGLGLPGISDDARARALAAQLQVDCNVPVHGATDLTTAWLGAFLGRPGIVVAAGTGSFAVGGYEHGSLQRSGGHGYLLGDQGGAYWLGKRALEAALADLDGTGPTTALRPLVEQHTGRSLLEFVRFVHQHPTERSVLAQLAPLVSAAAQPGPARTPSATGPALPGPDRLGDPVASRIIDEAADALAALVRPLQGRFGALPVAATGGTITGILRQRLTERITCGKPAAEPVIGAVLLAAISDVPPSP